MAAYSFFYVGSEVMGGKESKLSEKCVILCGCAKSILDDICDRIMTGNITVKELSMMKKEVIM